MRERKKKEKKQDHYIFTSDARANRNVDILRDMAKQYGIKYFYDIQDRSDFKANPDYKGEKRTGGFFVSSLGVKVVFRRKNPRRKGKALTFSLGNNNQ